MKSRLAFRFSVDAFGGNWVYLWTFTFSAAEDISEARKLWSACAKQMVRKLGLHGIRVFEVHPGGHGLHIHLVTTTRFDVRKVRAITAGYRMGRIHVKAVPREKAGYVGKYLGKTRDACMKGVRLWAAVGGQLAHRVKDIVIDSPFTRAYAQLKATFPFFASLPYTTRRALTVAWEAGDMRKFSAWLRVPGEMRTCPQAF